MHVSLLATFALSGCISLMTIVAVSDAVITVFDIDQHTIVEEKANARTFLSSHQVWIIQEDA